MFTQLTTSYVIDVSNNLYPRAPRDPETIHSGGLHEILGHDCHHNRLDLVEGSRQEIGRKVLIPRAILNIIIEG